MATKHLLRGVKRYKTVFKQLFSCFFVFSCLKSNCVCFFEVFFKINCGIVKRHLSFGSSRPFGLSVRPSHLDLRGDELSAALGGSLKAKTGRERLVLFWVEKTKDFETFFFGGGVGFKRPIWIYFVICGF